MNIFAYLKYIRQAFIPLPFTGVCHFLLFVLIDNTMDKGAMKKHAMESDLPDQKPKSKKAKLTELLQFSANLPHHSQSALAAILEKAKKSGMPDLRSSNHQREARLQLLDGCHGGALGPLIQEANLVKDDGATTTMFFANLLVYMMAIYNHNGAWTQLVQQCHANCPSSIDHPWGLITYCDEIIPGTCLGEQKERSGASIAPFWSSSPTFPTKMHGSPSVLKGPAL